MQVLEFYYVAFTKLFRDKNVYSISSTSKKMNQLFSKDEYFQEK
jgi:hypothetical protein